MTILSGDKDFMFMNKDFVFYWILGSRCRLPKDDIPTQMSSSCAFFFCHLRA